MDRRGNLSNEIVPRWGVTLDCLLVAGTSIPKKGWFKSYEVQAREVQIDRLSMARIWRTSMRGARFECFVFGVPVEFAIAMEDQLERVGPSPIRWVTNYLSRQHLQQSLAFRPDLAVIVDHREVLATWGNRGVALEDL